MYIPVIPSFTILKWGLRGSTSYRHVFVMKRGHEIGFFFYKFNYMKWQHNRALWCTKNEEKQVPKYRLGTANNKIFELKPVFLSFFFFFFFFFSERLTINKTVDNKNLIFFLGTANNKTVEGGLNLLFISPIFTLNPNPTKLISSFRVWINTGRKT